MSDNDATTKTRKTVSGIKNPDVVKIISDIRIRSRHVFLEYSVLSYFRTPEGQRMYNALRRSVKPNPASPGEAS